MKKIKIFLLSIVIIVAIVIIFVVYQIFFAPLPQQKVDFQTNIAPVKGELEKYTDASFGFSFFYPKEWKQKMEIFPDSIFFGTGTDITIQKINGRMDDSNSWLGHVVYYFDVNKKAWLVDSNTPENVGLMLATPIFYTDSGLPVFQGSGMQKTDIVALSPGRILAVNIAGGGDTGPLDQFVKNFSTTWKTYSDKNNYFYVDYPSDWKISGSPESDDSSLEISGSEGNINIATQGLGGACGAGKYEKVDVGGETFNACHWIGTDGNENWTLIYKQISSKKVAIGIMAQAKPPLSQNRPLLLELLKSFKFAY